MSDVWFTSDTHFNHRAMVEKQWRDFDSVHEMNECMVTKWNEQVGPRDTVWHLGDWCMGSYRESIPILNRLHGTKHLIAGNHDAVWSGHRDSHKHIAEWIVSGWASVQSFARRRINGHEVLLNHFPYFGDHTEENRYERYRFNYDMAPLIHGHVHDAWTSQYDQYNVGVDVRGFAPVHLDELAVEMRLVRE